MLVAGGPPIQIITFLPWMCSSPGKCLANPPWPLPWIRLHYFGGCHAESGEEAMDCALHWFSRLSWLTHFTKASFGTCFLHTGSQVLGWEPKVHAFSSCFFVIHPFSVLQDVWPVSNFLRQISKGYLWVDSSRFLQVISFKTPGVDTLAAETGGMNQDIHHTQL